MEYRTIPGADMSVSTVGLGCYGLGGAYGPANPAAFARIIARAREVGVTYYGTADQYGDAEEVLGQALRPFRREAVISTKAGLTADNGRDLSRAHVLEACDRSLRRLCTDHIDIYQVHFDDPKTPVTETVGALEDLQKAGKIRHYGVGHLPPARVAEYLGFADVKTVMIELSAVARAAYGRTMTLRKSSGYDFGIIGFSTTGRGLLTGMIREGHRFAAGDIRGIDPLFQGAKFRSGLRVADKLAKVGAKFGKTGVQVAVAWVLALPGVVTALVGPSRVDHLEENAGGADWTIPAEDLAAINAFLDEEERLVAIEKRREIVGILERGLSEDAERASTDLVYVMEEFGEQGLVPETDLIPLFRTLLGARKTERGPDIAALRAVHAQLRAMTAARSVSTE